MGMRGRAALELQRLASFGLLLLFGPIVVALCRWRWGYRAVDLQGVRKRFAEIRSKHPGPMILCTNHLTLIDSIVQGYILMSLPRYMTQVSALAWNLPERKNFNQTLAWRITCYLGRCIPVTRGGTLAQRNLAQDRMRYVLNRGDMISIFPEGTRSRSGRVDPEYFSYGSGQLLRLVPEATVVCVYLRGTQAGGFANYPQRGERFHVDLKVVTPTSESRGLRLARDYSRQIIAGLVELETQYFASTEHGQNHEASG
ncbi:MAG: 1-acyl-sn-glycerol-3-phosphate acyltransferase [Pseudomonadota bacterium]